MDSITTQWQPNKGLAHFLKHHSKVIVASIVLVVSLLVAGYRWWLHQQALQAQIATDYTRILPYFSAPPAAEKRSTEKPAIEALSGEKLAPAPVGGKVTVPAVEPTVEQFIQQHSQHAYGVLAAMQQAKYWVDRHDHEQAAKQLAFALNHARDANLRAVLRLRLARLQWQLKQPAAALATLDLEEGALPSAWGAQVHHLRANILQQQHDLQGASAAYQQALAASKMLPSPPQPLAAQQALIEMQLNDVADPAEHAK